MKLTILRIPTEIILVFFGAAIAGNPIITHMYTADPSAHVFEDRMFIYPSHDKDDNDWFDMEDYHVFSSRDMVNWIDHGIALHVDDVPWASRYMWAPDCVFRNGTYYFYFPARDTTDKFRIGVATGTNPRGPFMPESSWIEGSFSIDPAVFIDDNDTAYMVFGGHGAGNSDGCYIARLAGNMLEFDENPRKVEGLKDFFEAAWIHKRDGIYYLSYSAKHTIHYATAGNPYGPYDYKGMVIDDVSGWTNHHSFAEYNNQWYAFYHNAELPGGSTENRSVCVDYLYYNEDGTMQIVEQTEESVDPVPYTPDPVSAVDTVQAENYTTHNGIHTIRFGSAGRSLGRIESGDFLRYEALDFGEKAGEILLAVAGEQSGVGVEIRLDSLEGNAVAVFDLETPTETETWKIQSEILSTTVDGVHDVFFVFTGAGDISMGLDWFVFSPCSGVSNALRSPDQLWSAKSAGRTPPTARPLYDIRGRSATPSSSSPIQVFLDSRGNRQLQIRHSAIRR